MARSKGGYPGMRLDIAIGTGFVLETGVFCVYTCLFIAALPVLTNAKRRRDVNTRKAAWVFLIFSILMYLVAALHLVLAAFRFYKSIFLNIDPKGPIWYLRNVRHWEYVGLITLLCIQTWLGDMLVIYRCYVIWNNSLLLILIPTCLLFAQIGINIWALYWLRHTSTLSPLIAERLHNSIYPLAFAQNFITTSLIILKVSLQHRASTKAGIVDVGSKLTLIRIVRLVFESAAIYTIQIFVLVVLTFRRNNVQYTIQSVVPASIGLTFVLLAIRTEASRNERNTRSSKQVVSSLVPRWEPRNDSENSSEDYGNTNSLPYGDGPDNNDHKVDAQRENGENNSWDPESSSNSAEHEPPKISSVPL